MLNIIMWCFSVISVRSFAILMYTNDLPNSPKLLKFFLFADDTNIYFEADDYTTLIGVM